jgi:peptidoglycan/LPS O-acetylase OafA/YrhL
VRLTADFKENNLDFLRLIFAATVVLFHSSDLSGLAALAPLGVYCNPTFAVRGFFVISGLLIYRSYTRSSTIRSYLEKRVRRIYPAYFTIVVGAAIVLPLFSPMFPIHTYGAGFWKYLGANLAFLNFLAPNLPGVFTSNGIQAVNGALWTLKIEVAFYLSVPIIHRLCRKFGTNLTIGTVFALSCIWRYTFWQLSLADPSRIIWHKLDVQIPAAIAYFCAGILLLVHFDKLREHALLVSVIAACAFAADKFWGRDVFDVISISGFVLICGFWRYLGNFAKYGDFSYGVYIVHWPILQCMIWFQFMTHNAWAFLCAALALVFSASFLMWHLVEKRFLATSSHYKKAPAEVSQAVHKILPSAETP